MTVSTLLKKLEEFPPDADVLMAIAPMKEPCSLVSLEYSCIGNLKVYLKTY